jgi:(p)ppGpp synthase/HD superfamily hydrolase
MDLLELAIEIAVDGHKGQKDKYGNPYILHPLRVMFALRSNEEKIAGVLHDVVEDTNYTFEDLRKAGFSDDILETLDCVTIRKSETYDKFIKRVMTNRIAIKVKIVDLEDNMDVRRIKVLTVKDLERLNKYLHNYEILQNEIKHQLL